MKQFQNQNAKLVAASEWRSFKILCCTLHRESAQIYLPL